MEEKEVTTEVEATQTDQALEEVVEEALEQVVEEAAEEEEAVSTIAVNEAKRGGLQDMKKRLPDWSLEPPETFLS